MSTRYPAAPCACSSQPSASALAVPALAGPTGPERQIPPLPTIRRNALATATADRVRAARSTTVVDGHHRTQAPPAPGAAYVDRSRRLTAGRRPRLSAQRTPTAAPHRRLTRAVVLGQHGLAPVGDVAVPAADHRHDVLVRRLRQHITYRTSTTTASGSALRRQLAGERTDRRRSRTEASRYFTNRASAGFSCQTAIPWIAIHTTHHLDTSAPTAA